MLSYAQYWVGSTISLANVPLTTHICASTLDYVFYCAEELMPRDVALGLEIRLQFSISLAKKCNDYHCTAVIFLISILSLADKVVIFSEARQKVMKSRPARRSLSHITSEQAS